MTKKKPQKSLNTKKYNPRIFVAEDLALNPKDMVKFKNFNDLASLHKNEFKNVPLIKFEKSLYLILGDVVYYVDVPEEVMKK